MIINLPKLGPVRFADNLSQEEFQAQVDALSKKYDFKIPMPEYGVGETFMRGAKRGLTRMGSTFGDVIPAMGASALGFDEYAQRQMAEAAETQRQIQETNAPSFTSYKQVEDIPSALKFAAETIGETTPDILSIIGTGGVGGALAKAGTRAATLGAEQLAARAVTGQAAGVYLGSYAQNAPEVFQSVYQETGKLEPGVAALFGSVSAALDAVLPAQILKGMSQPLKLSIAEKVLERSGMNPGLLRKSLAVVPATSLKEGLTESAQEAINIAAEKFVDENAAVWGSKEFERMVESGVRGAVAGGGFGTVSAGVERLRERAGEQAPSAEQPPAGTQGEMFTAAEMGPEFSPLRQPADQQVQVAERNSLLDQERQIRGVLGQINAEMSAMANGQMAVDPARIDVLRKKAEDANAALTQIGEQLKALPELPGRVEPPQPGQLGLFGEEKPTRPISERMQATFPGMEVGEASVLPTVPEVEAAPKEMPTVLDANTLNATGLPKQSGIYKQLLGKSLEDFQDLDAVMQIVERAKTNRSLSADTKAALNSIATQAFNIYGQQAEMFGPRGRVLEPVKEVKETPAEKKIAEVTQGKDLTDPVQVEEVRAEITDFANGPTRSQADIDAASNFLDSLPSAYPEATDVIQPTEPVQPAVEPSPTVAEQRGTIPSGGITAPLPGGMDVTGRAAQQPDVGAGVQSTALTTKPVENWFEGVEGAAVTQYKGKNKLVEMPIDTFLKLAERDTPGDRQDKVARVKKIIDENGKFSAVPYLYIETDSKGNAKVTGHEGRHRARALKALGYNTIPVELRSSIRWSEQQDPENFDYQKNWPTNLVGQEGDVVPFPVSREQAGADYAPSTSAPAALEGNKPSTAVSAANTDIVEGQAREVREPKAPAQLEGKKPGTALTTETTDIIEGQFRVIDEETVAPAVLQLSSPEQQKLAEHYGEPVNSPAFLAKVREDIVKFATKGAQAIDKAIRSIIKKLHASVLAAAVILNPNYIGPGYQVAIPQNVTTVEQVLAQVPEAVKARMSPAAQQAYANIMPAIQADLQKNNKLFVLTDKPNARVFVFDANGQPILDKKVLLGLQTGDYYKGNPEKLKSNRVTPAGLFTMGLRDAKRGVTETGGDERATAGDYDFGKVFVLDKAAPNGAYSVTLFHSVYTKMSDAQARQKALAKDSPEDSRYSFGCINVDKTTYKFLLDNYEKQMDGAKLFIVPDNPNTVMDFVRGKAVKAGDLTRQAAPEVTREVTKTVPGTPSAVAAKTQMAARKEEEGIAEETKRALYRTPENPIDEGMPKSAVQKIVNGIIARWKNAPKTEVVQDIQELPPQLLQQMLRDNALSAPGVYDPNTQTVYLIADNIPNVKEAVLTLTHEALGHFGIQSILGNTYGKVMDDIYNGNAKVREAAKAKIAEGLDKHTAVEEVLAEMAEAGVYNNAIQRIFNAIRQFIRRLGFNPSKVTDIEVRELLANAQRFVVAGGPTREGVTAFQGKPLYRVGSDAFKKWFGNSVVRNPDGSPKLMYHGTARDIEEFRPKQANAIFVTDDPRFAGVFSDASENYMADELFTSLSEGEYKKLEVQADKIAKKEGTSPIDELNTLLRNRLPSRANIVPVYVSAQNPFDFTNPTHVENLAKQNGGLSSFMREEISRGSWETIEHERFQNAIRALGHDGFYVMEGGRKNLAVYDSSQIKSAFNQGTYSPTDKRILYRTQAQQQFNGATSAINGLPPFTNDIKEGALNAFSKLPDSLLNAALGFMTMPQIAEVYGNELPSINKLIRALENRATSLMNRRQHVSENIRKWYKIANQHKASLPKFFEIANKTTLDQIDVLDPAQANNPLTKQFKQLPQGLQDVYAGMRKEYDDNAKEFMALMTKNLSTSAASKMRAMFESNRLKVYLPLTRQGDYWLTFKDATGDRVSMAFDSPRERAIAAEKAQKAGATELKAHARLSQISFRTAPPTGFMGSVIAELVQNKVDPAIIDNVYQTYMSLFPAESLRQQFRKREGVAGFNEDVFQAYANVASKMAQQLSNLEYADPVETSVAAIRQEATDTPTTNIRDVVGNIERQLEFLRNPVNGSLVSKASYFSYMMYIAGNISSAVVNLTQLPIVVYPLLGGKYGFDKAFGAMQRASAMYWKGGKDNNSEFLPDHTFGVNAKGEYKQLYDAAVAVAAIRRSTGYEITEARNTSVEDYTGRRAQIEHGLGWVFQNSERANREITLIAAFDLARQNGKDVNEAINEALKVVNDAHGASLAEIGPRFFQQGIGKVAFTFKRFAQSQIYLLGRLFNEAFRGVDPETKRIARRQLLGISGMAYAFAGIQGMPMYGGISLLAEMLMGDDDEPFDMDAEIRAAFGDIGYKGPINQLLSIDIASRTGFNGLLWREDPKRLAEIGPTLYALEQAAGPAYGAFRSAERGLKLINEGQIERGMEALVPSFVRNGLKAFRLGTEGALTKDGTPITEDIGAYNAFMQVFGFNPAELAEAQARAGAMKTAEKAILARRGALLDKLDAARQSGDMDGVQDIRQEIYDYNSKHPGKRITSETMSQSYATRRRNERESVDGVTLDRKLRMELMEEYGQ